MISARKIYILFFSFLISAVTLNAQYKDIRIVFFSDNYTSASSLQNTFEQKLGHQNRVYDLDKVEKLPAFFTGQSYIFSTEDDTAEEISSTPTDFLYRAAGSKDVIATDSAILFQQPYLDKEIRNIVLSSSDKKNPLAPNLKRVRNGLITLPDKAELEVLTNSSAPRLQKGLWLPAIMVKYTLLKDEDETFVYILQKPLGGIGAWFNPVQNIRNSYFNISPSKMKDHLEKIFYLPARFVNVTDCSGLKVEVIRQQNLRS